jgi:hypothetical protein
MATVLWQQKDAKDRPSKAWFRLFGEAFDPSAAVHRERHANGKAYLMPNGRIMSRGVEGSAIFASAQDERAIATMTNELKAWISVDSSAIGELVVQLYVKVLEEFARPVETEKLDEPAEEPCPSSE